jgi:hypothetical protein
MTISFISLIFGVSGWATLIYNHVTHKPKIEGRMFKPIVGEFIMDNEKHTSFLVYIYLTNTRKTPVRSLDYKLEIKLSNGTEYQLKRFYGKSIDNLKFAWDNDKVFDPNLTQTQITKKTNPIDFKEPLHGFALFGGPNNLYQDSDNISKMRLTVTDVFGNSHIVEESNMDKPLELYLLNDLAGFEIPS